MSGSVTFTEKSAWVMCGALWITGSLYLRPVIEAVITGSAVPVSGPSFIAFVVILVILSIMGHIMVAVANPNDTDHVLDERDHQIAHRAGHWSGLVLGGLVITGLLYYLVNRDGELLFHMMFGAVIVAQFIEYATLIYVYRRGL